MKKLARIARIITALNNCTKLMTDEGSKVDNFIYVEELARALFNIVIPESAKYPDNVKDAVMHLYEELDNWYFDMRETGETKEIARRYRDNEIIM